MRYVHIFTEEPSVKEVLDTILPKIITESTFFKVYPHQGKKDLENAIKKVIPSISKTPGARIIISRDQDESNCLDVKAHLEELVKTNIFCPYKIRIVCKELESWFLGDVNAIEKAFPRFKSEHLVNKSEVRDVDSIVKPSSYLLRVIPEFSKREYLPKIETAERIAPFLDIDNNTSRSFNQMIQAIRYLVEN